MDNQTTKSLGDVEFTYDWYRAFLEDLQDAGFDFRTFSEGIEAGDVLLRHDLDLSIEKALATARIESQRGIRATYCILLTSALYNPLERKRRDQIRTIEALGHEVALHFSPHEYWDADDRPADRRLEERVGTEQDILGTILSRRPETVSFHIPPDWVLGRSFEGFRSTYSPAYFEDIEYVADSRQRWRDEPPSIPDPPSSVQILTHPGLWGETDGDFEDRVDRSVEDACHEAGRKAGLEFLKEGNR